MPDSTRDAFGRLVVAPERLSLVERVDALRRLAGSLQASPEAESRWMGESISTWLQGSAPTLEAAPQETRYVRAPPNSRRAECSR